MNKALISVSLIFLLPFISISQIIDFGEFENESIQKEGFQKFKEFIGDSRIVIIGEQEHGIGTHYQNFNFLSQFLHEEMDFDIIIQEYCFFEFYKVNDSLTKGKSAQNYRRGMYWPQGIAKEYNGFFNYLDQEANGEDPIQMFGADPRIFARDNFQNYLQNEFESKALQLNDKEQFFRILSQLLKFEYSDTISTIQEKEFFLKSCESLKNQYHFKKYAVFLWKERFIVNLMVFANNAWGGDGLKMDDPDRFFQREKGMADNIIWLAKNRFPDKKILIHLHNGHMAKNTHLLKTCLDSSQTKDLPNVGSLLNKEFGEDCLHFATSYYQGTFCKWDYKEKNIPSPNANSLEATMHAKEIEYGFMAFDSSINKPELMFYCDFNLWMIHTSPKFPVNQLFDGFIFVDEARLPTKEK